jgi:hypothetical protein
LVEEKPLSLLKTSKVEDAPHPVISFDVMRNSNEGATSEGYSLSSAFYFLRKKAKYKKKY